MVRIKTADIGALVAYDRMVGGTYTDLVEPRHGHPGDAYEFITCIAISKESLRQVGLPGHLGEALIYQAPPEGQVTEAESLVMNIAELLGVINEKASILNAIETLQKIRLAACFLAGLPSDAPSDDVCNTLYAIARPKPAPAPIPAGDEPVRVLRVIEYTGPRTVVEEQVRRSLHGTRDGMLSPVGRQARCQITAVTLGEYPEVLEAAKATVLAPTPIPHPAGTRGAALQAHAKTALANLRGAVGDNLPEMDAAIDAVCQVLSINPDDVYRTRPGTPLDTPPSPVVESAPQPTPPASEPESAAAVRSDGPDPEIPF